MSAAVSTTTPPLSLAAQRELARDMLLGQHSVTYTAEYTGLAPARVDAMAQALRSAKRIPKVRP